MACPLWKKVRPGINYHQKERRERVNIERVRELRRTIWNEAAQCTTADMTPRGFVDLDFSSYATTLPVAASINIWRHLIIADIDFPTMIEGARHEPTMTDSCNVLR